MATQLSTGSMPVDKSISDLPSAHEQPAPESPSHATSTLRDRSQLWLTTIILVCVGIPTLLAAVTGSLAIPHNDAWSHSRIAKVFGTTGQIELVGWNRSALLGQIIPLGPLGRWVLAQQLFVVALAVVLLIVSYLFLKSHLGTHLALFGTALVGTLPMFGLLATSFMADIPAATAFMLCVWLGDKAIRTRSIPLLALATLSGIWGVTIREQTLAVLAAVLLIAFLKWKGRDKWLVVPVGMGAVVVVAAFEYWRQSLPLGDHLTTSFDAARFDRYLVEAVLTLALFLTPVALSISRPWHWSLAAWVLALTTLGAGVVSGLKLNIGLLGNYLDPAGPYAGTQTGITVFIPALLWHGILACACISAALLVGTLITTPPRWDQFSGATIGFLTLGTVAQAAVGQDIFDRYLITFVPLILVGVLSTNRPSSNTAQRIISAVAIAGLLVFSLATTAYGTARDAARWHAAQKLADSGIPTTDIDAGFEWVGWHSGQPKTAPSTMGSWASAFSDTRACYTVASSQLPAGEVITTHDYNTFVLFGDSTIWVQSTGTCA